MCLCVGVRAGWASARSVGEARLLVVEVWLLRCACYLICVCPFPSCSVSACYRCRRVALRFIPKLRSLGGAVLMFCCCCGCLCTAPGRRRTSRRSITMSSLTGATLLLAALLVHVRRVALACGMMCVRVCAHARFASTPREHAPRGPQFPHDLVPTQSGWWVSSNVLSFRHCDAGATCSTCPCTSRGPRPPSTPSSRT